MIASNSAWSSANDVRIRHAVRGCSDRISRHASTPLPSSSRTSSTATSGSRACTRPTACSCVLASPTTLMSSSGLEQVAEPAAHDLVVVEQEHRDRIGSPVHSARMRRRGTHARSGLLGPWPVASNHRHAGRSQEASCSTLSSSRSTSAPPRIAPSRSPVRSRRWAVFRSNWWRWCLRAWVGWTDGASTSTSGSMRSARTSTTVLEHDQPGLAITEHVSGRDGALLVLATTAKAALDEDYAGSVSEYVLSTLRQPVLLVGPRVDVDRGLSSPNLVVAVDGSGLGAVALPVIASWTRDVRWRQPDLRRSDPVRAGHRRARRPGARSRHLREWIDRLATFGVDAGGQVLYGEDAGIGARRPRRARGERGPRRDGRALGGSGYPLAQHEPQAGVRVEPAGARRPR